MIWYIEFENENKETTIIKSSTCTQKDDCTIVCDSVEINFGCKIVSIINDDEFNKRLQHFGL